MKRESIIEYAAQNIKPDGNLNCAEWVLFYTARDIYKAYYNGSITIQAGEEKKKRALRQFELDNGELLRAKEILRQHAEMWRSIEEAGSRYRLNRTLENADAFIEAVYGVGIKNAYLNKNEGGEKTEV